MKAKMPLIARLLLGFVFFAAGLAGLLMPLPPLETLPEPLRTFNAGMLASKYLLPLVKGTETICGLMLLTGMWVPLALVILAPVILNIFLTHLFLAPEGLILASVLGALEIYLAFFSPYAATLRPLFMTRRH